MKKLSNSRGILKVEFGIWVQYYYGVTWQYFDNNFGDSQADEAWDLYADYWESEEDDYEYIIEHLYDEGDEE